MLIIHVKLELIKKIENSAMREQMSLRYGIGECTVHNILKQKDKLMQFLASSDNSSLMKRRKIYGNQQF